MNRFSFGALCGVALLALVLAPTFAHAAVLYSNGFESDTNGWESPTRVPSGTGGITSQSGSFHATTQPDQDGFGDFTRWGGYNYGAGGGVPTAFKEYWTTIGIYLDVGGGWANNTRFDFTSAINNSLGNHNRDFIFNGGFYNDNDGSPGSGTNRFIFTASNNSQPGSAFAKNPGRNPFAISTTGWYTFEHHFYDNGGVLAVDLTIYDSSNMAIMIWTLSDPTDLISGIGGNRYGWFDYTEFSSLAFDNTQLRVADVAVPEPETLAIVAMALPLLGFGLRRRRASRT